MVADVPISNTGRSLGFFTRGGGGNVFSLKSLLVVQQYGDQRQVKGSYSTLLVLKIEIYII